MTTLTITQRIQEGDSVLERSVSIRTLNEVADSGIETAGHRLVGILHATTWGTPASGTATDAFTVAKESAVRESNRLIDLQKNRGHTATELHSYSDEVNAHLVEHFTALGYTATMSQCKKRVHLSWTKPIKSQ